jgi:hypothetical protein
VLGFGGGNLFLPPQHGTVSEHIYGTVKGLFFQTTLFSPKGGQGIGLEGGKVGNCLVMR